MSSNQVTTEFLLITIVISINCMSQNIYSAENLFATCHSIMLKIQFQLYIFKLNFQHNFDDP